MKRGGKLLLLLAVMAVLIAGAYAVVKLSEKAEERERAAAETTEKETYAVQDIKAEDVTKIGWRFKDTELRFEKRNGVWVNAADDAFPVNGSVIDAQVETITGITTGKEIQNTEDKSQFGFDAPALTVTLNDSIDYVFGNGTNLMQGRYLLLGGKVYIVDYQLADSMSTDTLCLTEADVLLYDEVPEMAYVLEYKADCPSEDFHVDLIYVTRGDDDHSGIFYIRDDMKRTISQDQTISLVNNIYVTKFQHCVNYNASEEDLAAYGLDEPVMTIWLKFVNKSGETGEYTLYIGNATDENGKYHYAKLPDSKMVYAYDGYIYNNVLLKTYDYLEEKAQYDTVN